MQLPEEKRFSLQSHFNTVIQRPEEIFTVTGWVQCWFALVITPLVGAVFLAVNGGSLMVANKVLLWRARGPTMETVGQKNFIRGS
jgi:hypothetical protein